jgi:hypothetical protein
MDYIQILNDVDFNYILHIYKLEKTVPFKQIDNIYLEHISARKMLGVQTFIKISLQFYVTVYMSDMLNYYINL